MPPDLQMMGGWAESCTLMKNVERRRERRLALRWPILVSSKVSGRVETRTDNLSSGGFYCILGNPLAPGERIECDLTVPNTGRGHRGDIAGSIRCQAEVLRVEALGTDPSFGVACKILNFEFTKDLTLFKTASRSN
jgi:PilZ domain